MRYAGAIWLALGCWAAESAADLLRQAERHLDKEQFAEAEALLQRALKIEPANVEALYRLGYAGFRQRKLAQARASFTSVVKIAPPAYNSRYFLGRIALLENKPTEAIQWLVPVVNSRERVFDAAAQLSGAYAAAGEPRKAVAPLQAAIAQNPWDHSLYYRLGQLHQRLGEEALARDAFQQSTRLRNTSREDVEILMNVAQAAAGGSSAEALRRGAPILGRADADPNALVALGVIYGNASLHAEAMEAFARASKRDDKFFQAHFNYGLALLKAGRAREALPPLARAVELLPQSQDANTALGLAAVMNQKYREAVAPLEEAFHADPADNRVRSLLATAYLRTGAPAKAAGLLREVSESASADAASLLLLVEALNAAEDPEAALQTAQSAQKRFPNLPQAHMAVAQQLARLGRYQEARPAFQQTLQLAPGHSEAELGLADTLQKAGDHAAAAGHYRPALAGGSPAVRLAARLGLARSLVAQRQLELARQTLEEGLAEHPTDITIRMELSRVYARLGQKERAAEQTRIIEQLRAGAAR